MPTRSSSRCISPLSPLYLPCTSHVSPLYLQVELTLRRVAAMCDESALTPSPSLTLTLTLTLTRCDESALQRKQLAGAAHQAAFSGYASVNEPKLLIRSLVCP